MNSPIGTPPDDYQGPQRSLVLSGGGLLNIYVQMLEMSANGALNTELERIRESNENLAASDTLENDDSPVVVHIIHPQYPLPLDSDLYLDKIDHQTLMEMGYSDAKRYLRLAQQGGVPLQPESIQMHSEGQGFRFRESMAGKLKLDLTFSLLGEGSRKLPVSLEMWPLDFPVSKANFGWLI